MKRVIALILSLVVLFSAFPYQVTASDELQFAQVKIIANEQEYYESVICKNDTIYMAIPSIAKYATYNTSYSDFIFLRREQTDPMKAYKWVGYNKNEQILKMVINGRATDVKNVDFVQHNDVYYLPVHMVFPYLDSNVTVDGNSIVIESDGIAMSDAMYGFNSVDYLFNMSEEFGDSSGAAWSYYFFPYLFNTVTGFRFDRVSITNINGNTSDYLQAYENLMLDSSEYINAVSGDATVLHAMSAVDTTFDFAAAFSGIRLSADKIGKVKYVFGDKYFDLLEISDEIGDLEKGYDYLKFLYKYFNMVDDHSEMLSAVYVGEIKENIDVFDVNEYRAADIAIAEYESAAGLFIPIAIETVKTATDKALDSTPLGVYKEVAGALGDSLEVLLGLDYTSEVALLPYYTRIMYSAQDAVSNYNAIERISTESENQLRLSAILYLLASQKCYKTMAAQCEERLNHPLCLFPDLYRSNLNSYNVEIEKISARLAQLYLARETTYEDAFTSYEEKSKELQKSLKSLCDYYTESDSAKGDSSDKTTVGESGETSVANKPESDELAAIFDDLDYSAIVANAEQSYDIQTIFSADADNDGRKELFMKAGGRDEYEYTRPIIIFEHEGNSPVTYADNHTGAAGSVKVYKSTGEGAISEYGYYSTGITDIEFRKWNGHSWDTIAYYCRTLTDYEPDIYEYTCRIGNTEYNSEDSFNAEFKKFGVIDENLSPALLKSNYYQNVDTEYILAEYESHLKEVNKDRYYVHRSDIDGDGKDEVLYIINDIYKKWAKNYISDENMNDSPETINGYLNSAKAVSAVIYADTDGNNISFETFSLPVLLDIDDNPISEAFWDCGMLRITGVHDGKEETYIFDCAECPLANSSATDDYTLRRVSSRLVTRLENDGCVDVKIKFCDVCDAEGSEILCVYNINGTYTVDVYAVHRGKPVLLFRNTDYNAVYLTTCDEGESIFTYCQKISSNYFQDYEYSVIRFSENFCLKEVDAQDIYLKDEDSSSGQEFFDAVGDYVRNGTVCYDTYELTGYAVLTDTETDYSSASSTFYLAISNCSTSKTGVVKVEKTWLNFREGPSKDYDRILIDPDNKKSYVKQANGSIVTILDVENTGDSENPIWVKIQIKYKGKTLIGYSSARYLKIHDITHVSVGDTFTVEAESNETGLVWASSDDNVAKIDNNGKLKGVSPGLVMVIVTSPSGLSDTCLIAVD